MLYLKCKKRQRKGKVEMEVSAAQSHGTVLAEKSFISFIASKGSGARTLAGLPKAEDF